MRRITIFFGSLLLVVTSSSSAWSQASEKVASDVPDTSRPKPTNDADGSIGMKDAAAESPSEPVLWLHLKDGRRVQVDELIERADGYWFKRGNVSTFIEREKVTRAERISAKTTPVSHVLRVSGTWRISDSVRVERFFLERFGRDLPLGAFGQSDLHTRWRLDHRNGMDVSLHPESPEGRALINFLRAEGIPFLAFRGPIPGVATGPHIHVGNPSPRFSGRSNGKGVLP